MQCYDGEKEWAERDKVYNVAKVHRWSSYAMLILGNAVCSGGFATYMSSTGYGIWGTFGVATSIFFLALISIHEACMRKHSKKKYKLIEGAELTALV